MAGRRQHYIPQFLQRGFLDDPDHTAKRTWLHRRESKARLVGTKDIGVGENFYSKIRTDGSKTLDDLISEIEIELLVDFSALKSAPVNTPIDPKIAARLTTHLMLRTAHVRSLFEQGAAKVFNAATPLFTDPEIVRNHINVDNFADATNFKKIIEETLENTPLDSLSIPRPLARRFVSFLARENFNAFFETSAPLIAQQLENFSTEISNHVRDAHNKALETRDQTQWEKRLAEFNWSTQEVKGAILPDCVVLAREQGQELTPLLLTGRKNIELVILPLAHDRLLIGRKGTNELIDLKALNAESASCCDRFFISHRPEEGMNLTQLIGQRSINAINASVNEALSGFQLSSENKKEIFTPVEPTYYGTDNSSSTSFSLTLKDFGNSDIALRLAEIIKAIIREIGHGIPISILDGMTFALDYPAALASLNGANKTSKANESQPRDYGRAVAKVAQVIRDSEPKYHIVIDATIAYSLLSDSDEDRSHAIHLLLTMLSELVHTTRYESTIKQSSGTAIDPVSKLLISSISTAPSSFFCARQSAFADPSAGKRYADLVKDSYAAAQEAIRAARLTYRTNSDMDTLLNIALPRIAFVLTHAAEWLGHREGLPAHDVFPGSSLPSDLEAFELARWLELFGRDLRNLYDVENEFSVDNIYELSKHVERLLWTVQICPWPMEDGTPYVSVPFGVDLANLDAET